MRSRTRTVRAGVWLSVVCCATCAAYFAMTWSHPARPLMLGLTGGVLLGSLALLLMPLERLMRRPAAGERFFLAWSFTLIAVLAAAAVIDGGASSPLAFGLVLPIVFAALSYPVRAMIAVGVIAVAGYVLMAWLEGGAPVAGVFFVAVALAITAWMCGWQARIHAHHRGELARVSRSDSLTGCLNRRGFEERFAAELSRARRLGTPLGLLLVDLDHFKATNDSRGHAAGDALLCWTVERIVALLRAHDAVGRLGGDEFAVLLPGAGPDDAAAVAQRLSHELAERTPASCGVATFPADGESFQELHHHADLELYAVKHHRPPRGVPLRRRELSWAAALARTVDLRMSGSHEHSVAVAGYAAAIGTRLGMPDKRLAQLRLAAMLHDVGKVAVPERILRKPERLTTDELAAVRAHAAVGADMVARIEGLEPLVPWIRHLHEHVDGSGYPDGLVAEAIPLEARILLVADAFDAMTAERAYREPIPAADAIAELRRCAGLQFDAQCVEALAAAIAEAELVV